ncbi:MAG TPA: fumarylacetoacetate hydrolase family protein [Sphingomonadaceae bacterium]
MIAGTIYGVALNDGDQRASLASTFVEPPYLDAPSNPVIYIKTRNCLRFGEAVVPVPPEMPRLTAAATIALLFAENPNVPVAAALAMDVFVPYESFYRPPTREHCRDGFLPIGSFARYDAVALRDSVISTAVDGKIVHRWSPSRLLRQPDDLLRDMSDFMTLANGDVLLIGIPGDSPLVSTGATVAVDHPCLPPLVAHFRPEAGA